jgi:hypothetical protein
MLRPGFSCSVFLIEGRIYHRHCEPTGRCAPDDRLREAIQKQQLDCFVAEFIIGPAEGRTRWLLAMTRK